ncbi:hypothetical protein CDN98_03280 [Roseateles terrae]|nr:hypothetical protein CDN98_03280 [Roseateles terrae]
MNLLRMVMTATTLTASLAAAAAGGSPAPAVTTAPDELPLFVGKPLSGWSIGVADFEQSARLTGERATVPKQANSQVPASEVHALRATRTERGDALTLQWKESWFATLRLEGGAPVDLRPYLAHGTLEFDIKVDDLAKGGLSVKLACGDGCERKVNYLLPARALEGKGWQRLSFALNCFKRDDDDFSAVRQPFSVDTSGTGQVTIANVRVLKRGLPNAFCADPRTESVTPSPLLQTWALEWWIPRHEQKLAQVQQMRSSGPLPEVVFIGDSITQGWEDVGAPVWREYFSRYQPLNLGFGGDHTENVLWRLQHGEIDGIAPKVAVLMIGTNNTGDRMEDPRTTTEGIRRLITELRMRLPATRILLLAVFPREQKPGGPLRAINDEVNRRIASLADGETVQFLDIRHTLMNADGTLSADVMPDWLHLSEKGYRLWAEAMAPTLAELVRTTPAVVPSRAGAPSPAGAAPSSSP